MIRINLLPVKEVRQQESATLQLAVIIVAVGLALIGVIIVESLKADEIKALKNRVNQTEQEIQRMEKIIGEVNKFTETKKSLKAKLDIINQLRRNRMTPVRAMDDLSQRIPPKVWLDTFTENGFSVQMEGKAASDEDVALFLGELERSPYFMNVQLGKTELMEKDGYKKFNISAQVKYTL